MQCSLSLPSLLSQLCRRQWNGLLVSAVPIMIVCLMKGSTSPPSPFPPLLNEEDIKLKSQARSNGRSERVGGGEMLHTYLYYTTSGAIPVASPLPRSLPPPFRIILFLLIALLPTTIIPRRRRKRRRRQKRKISPSSDLSKEQSRILEEGRKERTRLLNFPDMHALLNIPSGYVS